jgi:hypothetical protein
MPSVSNNLVIFFAWQTDSPDKTNRRAIQNALRRASSSLMKDLPTLKIELEEATRGEPGSPNIPATILRKIESSDIFICDVTTAVKQTDPFGATPNPNVVFELGYAAAHLGWARIVMLFNEAFGTFPDDLPFDVDRQRAAHYIFPESRSAGEDTSSQTKLDMLVLQALKAILKSDPKRPSELKGLSTEEVQRQRDIESLKWLLATIHWPTIDQHISEAPHIVQDRTFHFWEGFNATLNNSLFHLYDGELFAKVREFHRLWGETLSYGQFYRPGRHGDRHIFDTHMDIFPTSRHEEVWNHLNETMARLREARNNLLEDLRRKYTELDLLQLNKEAWAEYKSFEEEWDRLEKGLPKT